MVSAVGVEPTQTYLYAVGLQPTELANAQYTHCLASRSVVETHPITGTIYLAGSPCILASLRLMFWGEVGNRTLAYIFTECRAATTLTTPLYTSLV